MQLFSWVLDERKFLSGDEVRRLRSVLEIRKNIALLRKTKSPVRDWFVVNLALFTGLRVMELSELKLKDLRIGNNNSSLIVRKGKNQKPRVVRFGQECRDILLEYLEWKKTVGEPVALDDPLIFSWIRKGAMTTRGLQKIFERSAKRAGIKGHSIHHLRHTYASHLYKASGYNLRLVQKQLGHSSIKITEVYADVLKPDLDNAVRNLYGR